MIGASLYIIGCSARNRLRVRLRRLREPRYLVGGIVGAAYFYFSFVGRFRAQGVSRRRGRGGPPAAIGTAALAATGPAVAGLALMVVTLLAWILPFDSGLLDFSKAELQFLFPAPVSRRSLLLHRMLRSQLGMLFGSVIVSLTAPSATGYGRLRITVAMWLLMCTSKIYFTGVSLARARLGSANAFARRVAWLPIVVLTAATLGVAIALVRAFAVQPAANFREAILNIGATATSGVTRVVLAPFMAVAWPLFATWPWPYLVSLVASVAMLAACVAWVLLTDQAFQETAVEVADRKATRQATSSSGYKVRGAGVRLAPIGRAELAFAWKAATQTLRLADTRSLIRFTAALAAISIPAFAMGRGNGLAVAIGVFATAGTLFSILMAPQAIRMDLRQDLQHLELLKTWPVGSASVVRGELLWPGALITGIAWLMIAMATTFSASLMTEQSAAFRVAIGVAAAIVAPAIVFAQLVINNAFALMFPAWVPLGDQRPRGFDAMGQRLIMLGGTWLTLLVMALPAGIAGGIVWFVLRGLIGSAVFIPAALAGLAVIAAEVLVATELMGPLYERIDVLAVERAE